MHAVSGCDTVSAPYRQGKRKAFNTVHHHQDKHMLETFRNSESTHSDIEHAGEQFLLKLYGAGQVKTLDKYRHIA